jgi:hypothetical protein
MYEKSYMHREAVTQVLVILWGLKKAKIAFPHLLM